MSQFKYIVENLLDKSYYPILETILQIAYDEYHRQVNDENTLKQILEEIGTYVALAIILTESDCFDNCMHKYKPGTPQWLTCINVCQYGSVNNAITHNQHLHQKIMKHFSQQNHTNQSPSVIHEPKNHVNHPPLTHNEPQTHFPKFHAPEVHLPKFHMPKVHVFPNE